MSCRFREARPPGWGVPPILRLVRTRREPDPAECPRPDGDRTRRRRLHGRRPRHRRGRPRRRSTASSSASKARGRACVRSDSGASRRRPRGGALPAVIAAVEAARRGAPIPSGLTPPIGQLRDVPPEYDLPDGLHRHKRSTATASRICRIGDRSSRKLIVLFGDSHALMWLPAVLEMARHDHWAVVPLVRLGCTPGNWTSGSGRLVPGVVRWALGQVSRLRPHVTLLGGSIGERPVPFTMRPSTGSSRLRTR